MLNKLRKLLGLCVHEWEFLEITYDVILLGTDSYLYAKAIHKCKHCSDIKSKRV